MLHIENAADLYTFTYWASVKYERVVQCSDSIIHDVINCLQWATWWWWWWWYIVCSTWDWSQGRMVSLSLYAITASGECVPWWMGMPCNCEMGRHHYRHMPILILGGEGLKMQEAFTHKLLHSVTLHCSWIYWSPAAMICLSILTLPFSL